MNRFVMFAIAWFILTAYGLFVRPPHLDIVPLFLHFDKFVHFSLFFGQFWLIVRAYSAQNRPMPILFWCMIAIVWAIVSELIQSQLPSRSADVFDALADILGAFCALAIGYILNQHRQRLMKEPQP
ncbi:VanZ family protein [Vitreoscilla stercoraria]|uniref:VanZ family protein n=1 Tax=Vitreoscilla stercoraria TaxID=61 RepID=A0ABY4E7U9_VITST|nr:VanZ family protein [Vitreoscilla stercoraria]UOO91532.1 VanZ family protein [Vitreoscilla stercoraria]